MPAAEKPTPTPEEAPARGVLPPKPAVEDGMIQGTAYVDAVTVLGAAPVGTVEVRVVGNLADGCTELAGHDSSVTDTQLAVTLYTSRDPNLMCTQALVPFDTVLTLDLPHAPETLAISVNGVFANSASALAVDADGCPVVTGETQLYRSGLGPFCFLYPAGYELFEAASTIVSVAAPQRMDGSADRVMLTLTFAQAAVTNMAQVEESVRTDAATAGSNSVISQGVVAGYPAIFMETPPVVVGSRQAYFLASGVLYTLTVQPIDPITLPDSTVAAQALWRTVVDSFAFASAVE